MTLIGFGHLARVGKDTAADILVEHHGFIKLAYADALRSVVYDSTPHIRRLVDDRGWEMAKASDPTVRRALQDVGAAVRKYVDPDAWVNALFMQMEVGRDYCISDVRFENEALAILDAGGQVVRIRRPGVGPVNGHVSETALANWDGWNHTIANDGTVEDLADKVAALVTSV